MRTQQSRPGTGTIPILVAGPTDPGGTMYRILTLALVLAAPTVAHAQYGGCNGGFAPVYGSSYSSSYGFRSAPAASVDLATLLQLLSVLRTDAYAASPFEFLGRATFVAPPPRVFAASCAPVLQSSYGFSSFRSFDFPVRTFAVEGFGGFRSFPIRSFRSFPTFDLNIRSGGGGGLLGGLLGGRRSTDINLRFRR